MTSPQAEGLFSQVIMESNPLALPEHTRKSATKNAKDVFEYLGCAADDVACMRTKTADQIVEAQNSAVKLDLRNLFINFQPFAPLVDKDGPLADQPFNPDKIGSFLIRLSAISCIKPDALHGGNRLPF